DPNIYSFDSALTFEVVVPEQGLGSGFTRVLAQWNTLGSILDINDVAGNAPRLGGELPTYTEILFEGVAPGPFGDGTDLEYLAVWDLVGNPSELSITFGAPGPHMSLAELIVDSAWSDTPFAAFNTEAIVPEPSSAVLVALSSILALCIQGRRRSRS
ncbi:MAG: hypothetical protein MI757_11270, partial [Pirellulales bacterium]|nr:hypothetical protein [Pirellulales bacterium]